ncbi:MAG TPA: zinc ribbon domain-containing protein [Terracidiphilus sp.]
MPLYPYRCTQCGHRFEKIQSFSAEPETVCPNCGKSTLERILTAPALQFKGAGWYVNDYSGKSSAPESSTPSSTEPKSSTDSAAKPAATAAPSTPAADSAPKSSTPAATS